MHKISKTCYNVNITKTANLVALTSDDLELIKNIK